MRRAYLGALVLLAAASAAPAQPFDHLHCYKIGTADQKAIYTADLTQSDPGFAAVTGCKIKVPPKLLCVDTQKTNVMPPPPGAGPGAPAQKYLCYKVRCPKVTPSTTLQDQFGTHTVTVKRSSMLCVPVPAPCTDADGDGFCAESGDCDDANPNVNPAASETCNGLDDNCNGLVDEGNPGGGQMCNTGQPGVCAAGTTACSLGILACTPNTPPSPEVCNGLDDNCNGSVDEGNPGGGQMCNTGQPGVCAAGTTACILGMLACTPITPPSAEVCNGLDDNCNGSVDDGLGTITCGTGQCQNTVPACVMGAPNTCTPNSPSPEICDGIDNNCDGLVDEYPAAYASCSPAAPTCSGGTCVGCASAAACTSVGFGSICSGGSCGCAANGDCTNTRVDTCMAGVCRCGNGPACAAGQTCNGGLCM